MSEGYADPAVARRCRDVLAHEGARGSGASRSRATERSGRGVMNLTLRTLRSVVGPLCDFVFEADPFPWWSLVGHTVRFQGQEVAILDVRRTSVRSRRLSTSTRIEAYFAGAWHVLAEDGVCRPELEIPSDVTWDDDGPVLQGQSKSG